MRKIFAENSLNCLSRSFLVDEKLNERKFTLSRACQAVLSWRRESMSRIKEMSASVNFSSTEIPEEKILVCDKTRRCQRNDLLMISSNFLLSRFIPKLVFFFSDTQNDTMWKHTQKVLRPSSTFKVLIDINCPTLRQGTCFYSLWLLSNKSTSIWTNLDWQVFAINNEMRESSNELMIRVWLQFLVPKFLKQTTIDRRLNHPGKLFLFFSHAFNRFSVSSYQLLNFDFVLFSFDSIFTDLLEVG